MVCSCQSKPLKKPNRLPPPPPPPPRWHSPAQSFESLNHRASLNYSGAESECYSEGPQSVRSVPYSTRSLQPQHRSYSPVGCCNSARSTSECCASSGYCSQCYSTTCCPPPQSRRFPVSCCETQSQHSVESAPPVPRERVFRAQLSVSPVPALKGHASRASRAGHRDRCKPLDYKRHVEKHIEKLFKYLADRRQRLEECEHEIMAQNFQEDDKRSIRKVLAKKETSYLRSLRTRLGPEDFVEIKKLGAGYMGQVSLVGKVERNGSPAAAPNLYAMKKLKKEQVFKQNHMAHVFAERDIMAESEKSEKSEWIVKLYYSFQDEKYLYFILEYVPGGDMMNLLCKQSVFPEDWARFYIAEISLALQFVHDMKFIHRDIKPDNILIDRNGHIKLADFGLCTGFRWTHDSKYYRDDTLNGNTDSDHLTITTALTKRQIEHSLTKKALSLVGSPHYIAPEVLLQNCSKEELCDWWSVGVILYEMIVGYCPFIDLESMAKGDYSPAHDPPEQIQLRIINWRRYMRFPPDIYSPLVQLDIHGKYHPVSANAKSLIQALLCDPDKRMCQNGILDLQKHPFFEGIDWQNIRQMKAPFVPILKNELDTSHFDQSPFETDATIGASPNIKMSMNDFTWISFWKKPISEFKEPTKN